MLNIVRNKKSTNLSPKKILSEDGSVRISEILSSRARNLLRRLRYGDIDNGIIRGLPVSDKLPDTPKKIRDRNQPKLEKSTLVNVAKKLGEISNKGVENTLRFELKSKSTNEETWHSHFQFSYSLFYCLRSDPNAEVFVASANDLIDKSTQKEKELFTTERRYLKSESSFSLISKNGENYEFSKLIFDRSDIEEQIEHLDLPDAMKRLEKIIDNPLDSKASESVECLIKMLNKESEKIVYEPGDLAMFRESSTIRYSPEYEPNNPDQRARWLLAVSVK